MDNARKGLGPRSRLYLLAMLIDTAGSGIWTPVALIFFISAQGMPAVDVGLAMTVGGLAGLVFGPLSGNLVDRWGPGLLVFLSNVARALAFVLYPFIHHAWQVAVVAAVIAASDRLFWTANTPLLGRFVSGRQLDSMLASQNVIRIVGLGAGAGVSGLFLGSVPGLHAVAYVNAGSYAVAAIIVVGIGLAGVAARAEAPSGDAPVKIGWRAVLDDRSYVLFCGVQVLYALCARVVIVILPLVALDPFGGPQWLPGTVITVAAVALALGQKPIVAWSARFARLRGLVLASVVFAVAFAILPLGPALPPSGVVVLVLGAGIIAVVGEALSGPLMIAAANEAAPEHLRGRYSALFQTAWGLATVASPAVFTGLLALGNTTLWLTMAVFALASVPALLFVAARFPSGILRSRPDA